MSSVLAIESLKRESPCASASLGREAARGAFWTILFSILNKGVSLGSQIALAWFLVPEQFGLAALVISIASVASIISGSNLKNLLIQRREGFAENAGQVFWLSLTMNSIATVCMALVAPLAANWFGDQRLAPLLWILCPAIPIMALPTVYVSRLYRDLRFTTIARIQFGEGMIRNGLALPLAVAGLGAASMVIPIVVSATFTAICCRWQAGPLSMGKPIPRLWPALLAPSYWLMLLSMITALQSYGTNLVLGSVQDPVSIGIYFWGFSLASQAIFLLASNLQGIFFPVLSRLNGSQQEQGKMFLTISRTLTLAIVPICVLQVLLAGPVVNLIFHERWLPSVPVVRWLSIGLLTQPLSIAASALLMARGQFKNLAMLSGASALVGMAASFLGGLLGSPGTVAVAVGCAMLLTNFLFAFVGSRLVFGPTRFCGKILPSLGIFLPLALSGWVCNQATGDQSVVLRIVAVTLTVFAVFVGCVHFFWPDQIRFVRAGLRRT